MKTFKQFNEDRAGGIHHIKDLTALFPFVKASSSGYDGNMWITPKNIREFRETLETLGYEITHHGDGMTAMKKGFFVISLHFDSAKTKASISIERNWKA